MVKPNRDFRFRFILVLILFFELSACTKPESNALITDSQFVFGTIVNVTFYGVNNKKATKALQSISHDLKLLHKAWDPRGDRALWRTNNLIKTTAWFSYNPLMSTLLTDGKKYASQSNGLFNPTLGQLIKLWGFQSDEITITKPPSAQRITTLLAHNTSMDNITLNGVRIKSDNPNVTFDFGGMAKGLAVDIVIESLKDFNINNAMINAGGDIKVIGQHGERPWHIGIRHPRQKDTILAGIDLKSNESIFTSGDYERFFIHNGKRYHHIIDPRTGYPATESMSVTVIDTNAALADAAATALFVAGPSQWHDIAVSMGIKFVLLVDAQGTIHMNPAMQKRIVFHVTPKNISISPPL